MGTASAKVLHSFILTFYRGLNALEPRNPASNFGLEGLPLLQEVGVYLSLALPLPLLGLHSQDVLKVVAVGRSLAGQLLAKILLKLNS